MSNVTFIITQVLARAARIESREMSRVGALYDRWNVTNKPLGNGRTSCLVCNSSFGVLEATPRICGDCVRKVCATCSIEAVAIESAKYQVWNSFFTSF